MNLKGEVVQTCSIVITVREVESGELIMIYGKGNDSLPIGSLYQFTNLMVSRV